MRSLKSFLWAVLAVAASGWTNATAANRTVGLSPCDGVTMFVKQFTVSAGTVILGAEFENNDSRTVFPEVLLVQGVSGSVGTGTVIARSTSVSETTPGIVRVAWSTPATVTQGDAYFLGIRIPEGSGKQSVGNGPGIGATVVAAPNGSY